ncbi:MAG: tryptophan--tRNA ligase [Thaumarchaeota archaeon]|nr:tryptophan--tRNA ligase [Nitrososphaerota archaeon]
MSEEKEFVVTPWEVRGEIDYERLIRDFGTTKVDSELLERIKKDAGELHLFLKRGLFFSHRDMNWILDRYEAGEKFFLYTGRGPSGHTHLGHLVPWIFTKWLQDRFGAELYFQMTDDEKFLFNQELSLKTTMSFTYENALDVIALGFDPKKTFIFSNVEYVKTLYKIALEIAKHVNFSTVKAVFGFQNTTNIGMIFFPALQAAPCFLPSVLEGKNIPCLIPASIDQDPYWRGIAREVAPKLGYYKPAQIHNKLVPGLGKGGKMSASEPETAIFTTDDPDVAVKKIMSSYTGGRDTAEEQRRLGGRADICPVYHNYEFLFVPDDKELKKLYDDCKTGKMLCGECKMIFASKLKPFLKEHQKKREKAKGMLDKFMVKD